MAELDDRLTKINDDLNEASTELTNEINQLRTDLANHDHPLADSTKALLESIEAKAAALKNVIPNSAPPPE